MATATTEFSALDVSQYQGTIDWPDLAAQVAAGTLGGVMVRATYGETGDDPDFAANWHAAAQAGVPEGPYHYADPSQDAAAQAQHCWATVQAQGGWPHRHLRPALDLEVTGGLTDPELQAWATTWLETVEQLSGVMPMLYGSQDFLETHLAPILGHWPLWVALWDGATPPNVPHVGHQYTDAGHVQGISGAVDLDRFAASVLIDTPLVAPTVDWSGSDAAALRWSFTPPATVDYRGWAQHPDTPAADPVFRTNGGYWDVSWAPAASTLVLTWWFGRQAVSVSHPVQTASQMALAGAVTSLAAASGALTAVQAHLEGVGSYLRALANASGG